MFYRENSTGLKTHCKTFDLRRFFTNYIRINIKYQNNSRLTSNQQFTGQCENGRWCTLSVHASSVKRCGIIVFNEYINKYKSDRVQPVRFTIIQYILILLFVQVIGLLKRDRFSSVYFFLETVRQYKLRPLSVITNNNNNDDDNNNNNNDHNLCLH